MDYSLYLIGSKARGDDHSQSDTDYVCIYDDQRPLLDLPMNSSVSYYSIARMHWMIKNSKLFVVHIIVDGIPIVEKQMHRDLLNSFAIDFDVLKRDLNEFIGMLININWIPVGLLGRRWVCDYIYTLARNIVYISNALKGFFVFGYEPAVQCFIKNDMSTINFDLFLKIRDEKYKYRASDETGDGLLLADINSVLSLLVGQLSKLKIGGQSFFDENCLSYEKLRLIERAIINGELADNGYLDKLKCHGDYFFILRGLAKSLVLDFNKNRYAAVCDVL